MPRQYKYEDSPYEKTEFSSKIFIYNSDTWDVLYPIVDIIRLLKKNSIVSFRYGKGQQIIKSYSTQYNHRILGYSLQSKHDYVELLKNKIKCFFLFTDGQDPIVDNMIKIAEKNKIMYVCYSNIDGVYHFYDEKEKTLYDTSQEVIEHMYTSIDRESAEKIQEIFPDFEIIEPKEKNSSTLDECMEKFKKTTLECEEKKKHVKLFDPHIAKIKAMEYERSQRNKVYPDDVENINKQSNAFIANLFKKQIKK